MVNYMGVISGSINFMFIVFIILIIICLGIYFYYRKSFKYTILIREVTGSKRLISFDKAKIIKESDGVEYLYLLKRRHKIQLPPPDSIELTKKGKQFIEIYFVDHGDYQYLKDNSDYKELLKNNIGLFESKTDKYIYIKDTNKNVSAFQPLTTNNRRIMADQILKANRRVRTSIWEKIPAIASVAMVIVVFAMVIIFYKDITEPSVRVVENIGQISAQQAQITGDLKQIIQQEQILKGTKGID